MYYLEVLFVYGKAKLQTFYGPFPTRDARDKYAKVLKQRERKCFKRNLRLKQKGVPGFDESLVRETDPKHGVVFRGRDAQGVRLMRLEAGDKVVAIAVFD